jgi:hypothetical protein
MSRLEGAMFVSLFDKSGLDRLSTALPERLAGVAYGNTADRMDRYGWQPVKPFMFLEEPEEQARVDHLGDTAARTHYTKRLVTHFHELRSLRKDLSLPVIDVVAVNLKPPTDQFYDIGGIAILEAAVRDRLVLTNPEQIPEFLGSMATQSLEATILDLRRPYIEATHDYLADYRRQQVAAIQASPK